MQQLEGLTAEPGAIGESPHVRAQKQACAEQDGSSVWRHCAILLIGTRQCGRCIDLLLRYSVLWMASGLFPA